LTIGGVTVNGNTLTFTLAPETPWATDTRYVVRLLPFGGGSIGDLYGNILTGDDPNSSVVTPAAASAISLKPVPPLMNGATDLYTFDSGPSALEFSTFTWTGDNNSATSAAALDALAQALDVSAITAILPEATGNPPGTSGTARYASETRNLITRPTGVIGNVIVARLRNDTGAQQGSFTMTYNLTDRATGTAEEIPGHLVYYSTSGTPNTWTQIPEVSNNGASGVKSGNIVTRWPAGAVMYIAFCDDNANGTEGIYEIDNFKVQSPGVVCSCSEPPVLVRAVSTDVTTIVLTFSEKMAASAGTTAPYSVSGATVTGASLNSPNDNIVTLTTTARPVGNSTVTITGLRDASDEANLTVPNPISFRLTTVAKVTGWADAWEYNTNNLDSAPTWKTTGGTGWQTGNALFGTETSAGVVAIMPTPIATVIPPPNTNNEFMVSYFRKTVTLPTLAAGQSYALGYMVDDGAVFYLDGNEIGRVNMPAGPVAYGTNAIAGIDGSRQALAFTATAGDHVLAVEVHQNVNASSDTLFGASVLVVPTASPSLTIGAPFITGFPASTNVMVRWNADSCWVLVHSTNVAGPYTAVGGAAPPSYSRPMTTPATQFYKLNYVPQQ
jgi:hypothetical protein